MNSSLQETIFSKDILADALMYKLRQVGKIQNDQYIYSFTLSPLKDGTVKIQYKIQTDAEVHIN